MAPTKVCSKCRLNKPLTDYNKQAGTRLGVRSRCISCTKEDHRESLDRHKERTAKYRAENAEKNRARYAKYAANNPEVGRRRTARWRDKNREKVREINRRHDAKSRATPRGRLDNAMSSNVHRWLAKGSKAGRSWEQLVGYTATELMDHLERQFLPGMTWENYGPVWHVDHHIPLSAHNYESPDHADFQKAWALTNLRPLWAFDNMSKRSKLSKSFQPSLAL
jgi:hypothetical protein